MLLSPEIEEDDPALVAAMTAAYAVVTRVIAAATAKGKPLTDDEASLVETYLAAHFYQVSDPSYSSRSTANKSGSFLDPAKKYQTRYMERAILSDPSGSLNAIMFRKVAMAAWLGKREDQKLTYEQRN